MDDGMNLHFCGLLDQFSASEILELELFDLGLGILSCFAHGVSVVALEFYGFLE